MQVHVGEANEIYLFDIERVIVHPDALIYDGKRRQVITLVDAGGKRTRVEFRSKSDEPLLDPSDKSAIQHEDNW